MNDARRKVLAALALGALLPAAAKSGARKRLAVVHFGSPQEWTNWIGPFVQALARLGLAEGRDFELLQVGLDTNVPAATVPERRAEAMARQVEERVLPLGPDAIVTTGPIMSYILSLATRTVPVVTQLPDPVGAGYAKSLAKPGGNMTGLADNLEETSLKAMELMKQLVPRLSRVAIYGEARPMAILYSGYHERAARRVGVDPVAFRSNDHAAQLATLGKLASQGIQAGLWAAGSISPKKASEAAMAARVPFFGPEEAWVRHGSLACYEGYEPAPEARMAAIAAQILRGASPADLPFQLPQHFRLAINRRTAASLGIAVPPDLLLRADKVFE